MATQAISMVTAGLYLEGTHGRTGNRHGAAHQFESLAFAEHMLVRHRPMAP